METPKFFKCEQCGAEYWHKHHLNRHVYEQHTQITCDEYIELHVFDYRKRKFIIEDYQEKFELLKPVQPEDGGAELIPKFPCGELQRASCYITSPSGKLERRTCAEVTGESHADGYHMEICNGELHYTFCNDPIDFRRAFWAQTCKAGEACTEKIKDYKESVCITPRYL